MRKPKTVKEGIPNPGTEAAQKAGCRCPVMDNHYGKGYYNDGKTFVYNMSCPLHYSKPEGTDNASS